MLRQRESRRRESRAWPRATRLASKHTTHLGGEGRLGAGELGLVDKEGLEHSAPQVHANTSVSHRGSRTELAPGALRARTVVAHVSAVYRRAPHFPPPPTRPQGTRENVRQQFAIRVCCPQNSFSQRYRRFSRGSAISGPNFRIEIRKIGLQNLLFRGSMRNLGLTVNSRRGFTQESINARGMHARRRHQIRRRC